MSDCIFCDIVAEKAPAEVLGKSKATVVIRPLYPVIEGHELVIPRKHAEYIWDLSPEELGETMVHVSMRASRFAFSKQTACNIIQSNGKNATQTIQHVHFHVVPRHEGDGLKLPWTDQGMSMECNCVKMPGTEVLARRVGVPCPVHPPDGTDSMEIG